MADYLAPDDQQESSEDLALDPSQNFSDAVVTSTHWTTQTVLSQLTKGNIELNPAYQRRDAWKDTRKSKFIESLVLGIPIPQLVLAERKDRKNSFIVIDGKQRLLSLRQFCAKPDDQFTPLSLKGLDIRADLEGATYDQLSSDDKFQQYLLNFENQPIRTVVIRNWPNEKFLYQVFLRLNTGSVPLSPQELRQALHPGLFSKYVDDFSSNSTLIQTILGLEKADFRMRDAELVIRYFAFRNFLADYKGNLSPLFDETTALLNAYMKNDAPEIHSQADNLLTAIEFTMSIFGDFAFRKWNGINYEKALNRAVFDVMVLFFDNPAVRDLAAGVKPQIEIAFKNLCVQDREFRSSIEGTTKSIGAIHTRLSHWAETLIKILGVGSVRVPELVDGRIILETLI